MSVYRRAIVTYALPAAVATAWAVTASLGTIGRAPLATLLGALLLMIPLSFWAFHRHPTCNERRWLLITVAVPIVVLLIASLLSDDPRGALIGGEPLYQGWLLWAVLYGWFALVLLGAKRIDLLNSTAVLSVAGSLASLWAFAEYLHLVPSNDPVAASPMALFDNPNSLGQVLVITLACTAALLSNRRQLSPVWTPLLWFGAGIQLVALQLTHSVASWAGLVVGLTLYALLRAAHMKTGVITHGVLVVALLAFLGLVFASYLASSGVLGRPALNTADRLLSQRPEVWESAAARIIESPLLGEGASEFESLTRWDALPNGDISYVVTYDPHGIGISWLLSAGFIGLIAFTVAGLKIALRLTYAAQLPGISKAVHWLCAGVAASGIAMLTSWPEPLALLSMSVIVGAVIAKSIDPAADPHPRRHTMARYLVPVAATSVIAMFALVWVGMAADAEYDAMRSHWQSVHEEIAVYADEQRDSGDPFYQEAIFNAVMAPGTAGLTDAEALDLIRTLDANYPVKLTHQVDLPLMATEILWIRRHSIQPDEYWALSDRFVARGRNADPTLAVWDFVLARAAVSSGRPDADRYMAAMNVNEETPADADEILERVVAASDEMQLPPGVITTPPAEQK